MPRAPGPIQIRCVSAFVTATYNRASLMVRTAASVFDQADTAGVAMIVIGDGSTDDTAAALDSPITTFSRTHFASPRSLSLKLGIVF